ncbi:peptide-N(4)-(N-acetyl-beta-glucosaminyl)asparagine amidase [Achroia grisella]|uniref:peptide-N(4)-(N-acetyl-beta- glucosaminyl)asparagine amidase n=1 Tax=Achroia grisella TaxID=688607 RepID=UPI0027D263D2|nr:peptide-N(4)-(N-acetyl-beta-glucosaminyl)asparagine amidase [Achroia grisella]
MEDMARLALVEQSVRDSRKFSEILYEVLGHIISILENPHDYELRTISGDFVKKCKQYEALVDYMKYIGFQLVADTLIYPKDYSLSKLRIAQVTIERKLCVCYGGLDQSKTSIKSIRSQPQTKKTILTPANILKTKNPLLLKIEALFNNMIKYEDEDLQDLARQCIPIVTLQLMAIDRVRERQKKIKAGEFKGQDLPFDIALLMELINWFKHKFFSWVDKPACKRCGGETVFAKTTSLRTETETCTLELYHCYQCEIETDFPRYNDLRALLKSRRGRCGEWANCFTLICRAMGYDTRYVYDVTDHVWCEVYDYDTKKWLHVDPCEAIMDAPLTYSHGWGKKLSYVIGVSRDDLQDVTWRYTTNHKQILGRRNLCNEADLITGLMTLREHRQRQVSEARRRYLTKRALEELVELMVERKPNDSESHGRITGSKDWRAKRGEIGNISHTFELSKPGNYSIRYYPSTDKYRISCDGGKDDLVIGWEAGTYERKGMFRKIELDWKQVYLAREPDENHGSISWRLSTTADHVFKVISIQASTAVFETGKIDWKLKFDNKDPVYTKFSESPTTFSDEFTTAVITVDLSGGNGDVAWQHAQIFRQSLETKSSGFEILATVVKKQ